MNYLEMTKKQLVALVIQRYESLGPGLYSKSHIQKSTTEELVDILKELDERIERKHRLEIIERHIPSLSDSYKEAQKLGFDFVKQQAWAIANSMSALTVYVRDMIELKSLVERYDKLKLLEGETLEGDVTVTPEDVQRAAEEVMRMIRSNEMSEASTISKFDLMREVERQKGGSK